MQGNEAALLPLAHLTLRQLGVDHQIKQGINDSHQYLYIYQVIQLVPYVLYGKPKRIGVGRSFGSSDKSKCIGCINGLNTSE